MKENDVIWVSIEESDKYDKDGNIIKIWDSKEQVHKAGFTSIKSALRQGFNRYFNGYF